MNATAPATRVRWMMLGFVVLIMLVDSLDRAVMGIAGKGVQDEFLLRTQTMGWVLSAYTLGYALFQLPWGYAGDRFGPRRILLLAVVWSSLSTGATVAISGLRSGTWLSPVKFLFVARFLVGVGVAAAAPNLSKVVARWMSVTERGIGSSFMSIGVGVAGIIAPIAFAFLMQASGWRLPFYLCAAAGLLIAAGWTFYSRDDPEQHPGVNSAELAIIRRGREGASGSRRTGNPPWKRIVLSRPAWMLFASGACQGYAAYVFYNWFFLYLVRVRGLTLTQGGWWGAAPFMAMTALAPLGGWVSDRAVGNFGRRRGRQIGGWIGMGLSGVFLWAGGHVDSTTGAILLLSLGAGFNFFGWAAYWAACIDLAPHFSGSLTGVMNTFANLGGWVSPILTAYVALRMGWNRALDLAALITLLGALLWLFIDADRSIERASEQAPSAKPEALAATPETAAGA